MSRGPQTPGPQTDPSVACWEPGRTAGSELWASKASAAPHRSARSHYLLNHPLHPAPSVKKLSSTKPVPGAKKAETTDPEHSPPSCLMTVTPTSRLPHRTTHNILCQSPVNRQPVRMSLRFLRVKEQLSGVLDTALEGRNLQPRGQDVLPHVSWLLLPSVDPHVDPAGRRLKVQSPNRLKPPPNHAKCQSSCCDLLICQDLCKILMWYLESI